MIETRQLKKSFARLAHFSEQARRGRTPDIIDLRHLLFERRRVGPRRLAVIEHFA